MQETCDMRMHKPVVGQWYGRIDKGQPFQVTAIDKEAGTIEMQHDDGDVEEVDLESWYQMSVEPITQPEDWTGSLDDLKRDDLGYSETEVRAEDRHAPLHEQDLEQLEKEQESRGAWEEEE
jgi:hypothetical protein